MKGTAMVDIHITSESGMLVAEVNGEKAYELCDTISRCGLGFGDTFEVDGFNPEHDDICTLADMIEDKIA